VPSVWGESLGPSWMIEARLVGDSDRVEAAIGRLPQPSLLRIESILDGDIDRGGSGGGLATGESLARPAS
jgi:hypothetical protein